MSNQKSYFNISKSNNIIIVQVLPVTVFKLESTSHSKVDKLIGILRKKDNSVFEAFLRVVKEENSDLEEHLIRNLGETIHLIVQTFFKLCSMYSFRIAIPFS